MTLGERIQKISENEGIIARRIRQITAYIKTNNIKMGK